MNANAQSKPVKSTPLRQQVSFYVALLAAVFLLGFVPMWLKSRQYAHSLFETERQLSLVRIHNALISAVIEVWQNHYEPARQAASDFFTFLRIETDKGDEAALSPTQRKEVQLLFSQRDEIITLLAQSDPAAVGRLAELYGLYRKEIYNVVDNCSNSGDFVVAGLLY
jgi:hypothetical protein